MFGASSATAAALIGYSGSRSVCTLCVDGRRAGLEPTGMTAPHPESRRKKLPKERSDELSELVGALHDLGVSCGGQDRQPAVGEQVEHLRGVVEAYEVPVTDDQEGRSGDRADLRRGPTGEVVDHRLHAFEE